MIQGCKLYLTYRSEYLVLRDLCVAVRDRRTSMWLPMHVAACSQVLGPAESLETVPPIPSEVRVGEQLCLQASARRIVTGPVVAIEEPTRQQLEQAERRWQELFRPSDARHSGIILADQR